MKCNPGRYTSFHMAEQKLLVDIKVKMPVIFYLMTTYIIGLATKATGIAEIHIA